MEASEDIGAWSTEAPRGQHDPWALARGMSGYPPTSTGPEMMVRGSEDAPRPEMTSASRAPLAARMSAAASPRTQQASASRPRIASMPLLDDAPSLRTIPPPPPSIRTTPRADGAFTRGGGTVAAIHTAAPSPSPPAYRRDPPPRQKVRAWVYHPPNPTSATSPPRGPPLWSPGIAPRTASLASLSSTAKHDPYPRSVAGSQKDLERYDDRSDALSGGGRSGSSAHAGRSLFLSPFIDQLRMLITTSSGFFTDSMDGFVSGQAIHMIFLLSAAETLRASGEIASTSSTVPPVIPSAFGATYSKYYTVVRIATLWGSLLGNLIFGYIGDRFGRKKMYGTELIVIVISTFGMSFSASSPRAVNIVAVVMIWRFLFAIGIGGDVPTSTVIAAESAPTDSRGLYVVTLYTAQATGAIVGGCLTMVALSIAHYAIDRDNLTIDIVWRAIMMCVTVPSLLTIWLRLALGRQAPLGDTPPPQLRHGPAPFPADFSFWTYLSHFRHPRNRNILLAVMSSSFLLGFSICAMDYIPELLLEHIGWDYNTEYLWTNLWYRALGYTVFSIPYALGFPLTLMTIDRVGRRPIQVGGFMLLCFCYMLWAVGWDVFTTNKVVGIVLYCFTMFFFNFGPNATGFIIPAEIFPEHLRCTSAGLVSAVGKLGTLVGALVVRAMFAQSPQMTMATFGLALLIGAIVSLSIPETAQRSLEELELSYHHPELFEEDERSAVLEWLKRKTSRHGGRNARRDDASSTANLMGGDGRTDDSDDYSDRDARATLRRRMKRDALLAYRQNLRARGGGSSGLVHSPRSVQTPHAHGDHHRDHHHHATNEAHPRHHHHHHHRRHHHHHHPIFPNPATAGAMTYPLGL